VKTQESDITCARILNESLMIDNNYIVHRDHKSWKKDEATWKKKNALDRGLNARGQKLQKWENKENVEKGVSKQE